MTALRSHPPLHRYLFLLCAAIIAAALFSTYVRLLHEQVARGAQWRGDPRAPAGSATVKAVKATSEIT